MKKSQRITRIAQLSGTEQRIAAQAFAAVQREVSAQAGQLRSLQDYRDEYLKRLGDGAALSGYEAQKLRVFVRRIDQALAALEQKLRLTERRCERERQRMLGHQRRVNALEDVAARALEREAQVAEAALQREIDDLRRELPML